MAKIVLIGILIVLGYLGFVIFGGVTTPQGETLKNPIEKVVQKIAPSPTPAVTLKTPPESKTLQNSYHIFQSFNNCGPASLSMTLSYFGIKKSQEELGQELRPYQIPGGDNDDKSVTLEELAEKGKEFGLVPYHRPNGNIEIIKKFIAYDIPIITRTYLHPNEDIGHYRVVKGYDENSFEIIQDDSFQGKNLRYTYSDFNSLWEAFNFEYLVLVPKDKQEIAEAILSDEKDAKKSWEKAVKNSLSKLEKNPDSIYDRFNLSVAYYNVGDFQKSAEEFEKVENKLSFRTLWYQIEPIEAYFELGNYDRVLELTERILNNQNRAFSELYILRGKVFQKRGDLAAARAEFEKAVQYNVSLKAAKEALDTL